MYLLPGDLDGLDIASLRSEKTQAQSDAGISVHSAGIVMLISVPAVCLACTPEESQRNAQVPRKQLAAQPPSGCLRAVQIPHSNIACSCVQNVQAKGCDFVRINDMATSLIQMIKHELCRFPTWTLRTGDSSSKE